MSAIRKPADYQVRDSIVRDTQDSVFITAGAGAGKTRSIVDRIVQLITDQDVSKRVEMSQIVAITFTTKAAGELRNRLRDRLMDADLRIRLSESQILAADVALNQLDAAPVGTIHAFSMRILRQYPLEAKLPIGFTLLDTSEAKRSNRALSNKILSDLYKSEDKSNLDAIKRAGIRVNKLREFVNDLQEKQPQLLEAIIEIDNDAYFSQAIENLVVRANNWWNVKRDEFLALDRKDKVTSKIDQALSQAREAILDSPADYKQAIECLAALLSSQARDEYKYLFREFKDSIKESLAWHSNPESALVENTIRRWTVYAQSEIKASRTDRRLKGDLDFNDLLLITYELLRDNLEVRRDLHNKLKVYVVDEFQDTDPLQWKIIQYLVSKPEKPDTEPSPGRLVAVGDPKQSIYRFRGADLATFEKVRERASRSWGKDSVKHLTTNFRSHPHILSYVDYLYESRDSVLGTDFEKMIPYSQDTGTDRVFILQGDGDDKENKEVIAVAATIERATKTHRLPNTLSSPGSLSSTRPATYRDIALLIPARTSLTDQLEVFEKNGIPYTSTDATIVYSRPAVRGLISAMKVLSGSVNGGDLWWALKSPLFGISDQEMLIHKKTAAKSWPVPIGSFRKELVEDSSKSSASVAALEKLHQIWKQHRTAQPSEILEILMAQTRLQEALDQLKTGRFENDCLRMVILHAKLWEAGGGNGVVDYVDWLKQMEDEDTRENLPSTDNQGFDAVTISTIHSAKGLEYPIVIIGGMWNVVKESLPLLSISSGGRLEFNLGKFARSIGFIEECVALETKLSLEERHRLLYVGATRAEHYLYVSNHHRGDVQTSTSGEVTQKRKCWAVFNFEIIEKAIKEKLVTPIKPELTEKPSAWRITPTISLEGDSRILEIEEAKAISRSISYIRPSDAGRRRSEEEVTTPASAYGNALHSVMFKLARRKFDKTWKNLSYELKLSASEHGVLDRVLDLERDVAALLETQLIERARTASVLKPEIALMARRGNNLVRGSADLVFGDTVDSHLVLIDYKTNQELTKEKIEHYREQLAEYAEVLEKSLGKPVVEKYLIHVHQGVVSEISL